MDRSLALLCTVLSITLGCGGATRPRTFVEGELPIAPGTRLYFSADGPRGRQDLTVAITDTDTSFAFQLACAHVEPPVALSNATTASVDASAMQTGRDEYAVDRCDRRAAPDETALPSFLVSQRSLAALARHERTMLRVENHGTAVALMSVGTESIDVRIDGRTTHVPTLHARGDGMDVWIADVGTPVVVRMVDHERGFVLSGVDTGRGAPRARP